MASPGGELDRCAVHADSPASRRRRVQDLISVDLRAVCRSTARIRRRVASETSSLARTSGGNRLQMPAQFDERASSAASLLDYIGRVDLAGRQVGQMLLTCPGSPRRRRVLYSAILVFGYQTAARSGVHSLPPWKLPVLAMSQTMITMAALSLTMESHQLGRQRRLIGERADHGGTLSPPP